MKWKTITLIMFFVATWSLLSAQGLTVEPNTNIKVLSGTTLKVADGDLLLRSDATGDATAIAFGSVTHGTGGKAIVERHLPGDANAWHIIGAPVNDMPIASSDWAPDTDEDFYLWLETSPGTWVNYKNTTEAPTFEGANPGDNFAIGKGYIANYNTTDPTNNFESGGLNTGNINIVLAKSSLKSWTWSAGQNLICNPYASGLDWNQVDKEGKVTEEYAECYFPDKPGGAGYEPVDGIIASGQGFFVQAVYDGATLELNPSQQVHGTTQNFMKQSTDRLVLRLSNDTCYDECKIVLNEASVPEHDFRDASKYFSFEAQVPQLYTLGSDGWQLAINSMDAIEKTTVITLSIRVQGSEIMSIDLTEIEGAFSEHEIYLHDLLTNTLHKLSDKPGYNFMADEADDPNRFLLKFAPDPETEGSGDLHAWAANDRLFVFNSNAPEAQIELFNIQGKLLLRKEIGPGLQSLPVHVAIGSYVVLMRTETTLAMRKLFIR